MPKLGSQLELDRCPFCNVDRPYLGSMSGFETLDYLGGNKRYWRSYKCARCGGVVTASAAADGGDVLQFYPSTSDVDTTLPEKAREYLKQAINSLQAPAGGVMLAASAVDEMLKANGYKEGGLYDRINKAADNHLITREMALWAHDVRIGANEQRHADELAPLPSTEEAKRCVDFALALGQFLFVLPARVQRGIMDTKKEDSE